MKISIHTDETITETKIDITCEKLTPEIEKVLSMLRILDMKLTGQKNNEIFILDACEILYIDSVDKKTFLYTKMDVYESNLRLYELEEQLSKTEFFRASKSIILNLKQIASLRADFDGKIKVTMTNGEKRIVSRQYARNLKQRLGVV
ncbi:MAG: LytTR family DNA-binding domain-containing protein [Velocimicrobium sp.]